MGVNRIYHFNLAKEVCPFRRTLVRFSAGDHCGLKREMPNSCVQIDPEMDCPLKNNGMVTIDVTGGNTLCLNCAHHGGMGAPPFEPSGECVPCQADTEHPRSRWAPKPVPAKLSRKWERVEGHTFRLKVPGGWIVQIYNCELSPDGSDLNPSSPALCFCPDPNHEWLLEEN